MRSNNNQDESVIKISLYSINCMIEYLKPSSSSSSSWCPAASTDFPDYLSPPVFIVHCSREVFQSVVGTLPILP